MKNINNDLKIKIIENENNEINNELNNFNIDLLNLLIPLCCIFGLLLLILYLLC